MNISTKTGDEKCTRKNRSSNGCHWAISIRTVTVRSDDNEPLGLRGTTLTHTRTHGRVKKYGGDPSGFKVGVRQSKTGSRVSAVGSER